MDDAGPAKKAGLRVGDIILNLDGESVSSIDDIYRILGEWPVGEAMKVSALRGGVIPSTHRSDDKTYTENRSGRESMAAWRRRRCWKSLTSPRSPRYISGMVRSLWPPDAGLE